MAVSNCDLQLHPPVCTRAGSRGEDQAAEMAVTMDHAIQMRTKAYS